MEDAVLCARMDFLYQENCGKEKETWEINVRGFVPLRS